MKMGDLLLILVLHVLVVVEYKRNVFVSLKRRRDIL